MEKEVSELTDEEVLIAMKALIEKQADIKMLPYDQWTSEDGSHVQAIEEHKKMILDAANKRFWEAKVVK